ncbi:MAG: DsbA family protein [Steroidobacteraceae bacterium]
MSTIIQNTADQRPGRHVAVERSPIKVIQYGDFECTDCGKAAITVSLFRQRFGKYIQFAYRHFPLEALHPHAIPAAEAAECARAQGKFWTMHDLLFSNQDHLSLRNLYDYAEQADLDMTRFTTDMDEEVHLPAIRRHVRNANAGLVRSTPTFFVDGIVVDRSSGLRGLFERMEGALTSLDSCGAPLIE